MSGLQYQILPIRMDEWLPDGCMSYGEPINPATDKPRSGCDSLQPYTRGSRDRLLAMYREVLQRYGCCGFVAWVTGGVVGYSNFFTGEQKSCRSFWEKLGFHMFRAQGHGEHATFSMALDLQEWRG